MQRRLADLAERIDDLERCEEALIAAACDAGCVAVPSRPEASPAPVLGGWMLVQLSQKKPRRSGCLSARRAAAPAPTPGGAGGGQVSWRRGVSCRKQYARPRAPNKE